MNDQRFLDALDVYYKLKSNYEAKQKKSKNKIIKNDNLSIKEKQDYIKKLIPKCINCKRPVGSIFTSENRTLKAVCGDTVHPCNLHIELFKSEIIQISDMTEVFKESLEEFKENIIKTKLDLIFGYEDETTAISNFESNKAEYISDKEFYDSYRKRYLDVVDNTTKKVLIQHTESEIYNTIQDIKNIIKPAINSTNIIPSIGNSQDQNQDQDQDQDPGDSPPFIFRSNIDNQDNLIRDAVELYLSNLVPILESLKSEKYAYMSVEDDIYIDNVKRLIQKTYTDAQVEITLGGETPQIIAFQHKG
jgi:hypothetical protein